MMGTAEAQKPVALKRTIATVVFLVAGTATLPITKCLDDAVGFAEQFKQHRSAAHNQGEGECFLCNGQSLMANLRHPSYLTDMHFGSVSGLLVIMATVMAGIGADVAGHNVLAIGVANLVACSCSIGVGDFLFQTAKQDFARDQFLQEMYETKWRPSEEVDEMVCHYTSKGLSLEDARNVAKTLSRYEDYWVEHMMKEELGLDMPESPSSPALHGLAMGGGFLVYGMVPLLGLGATLMLSILWGPQWFHPEFATMIALVMSVCKLLLHGVLIGKSAGTPWTLKYTCIMITNGCLAAVLAFVIARFVGGRSRQQKLEHECVKTATHRSSAWEAFGSRFLHGIGALWVMLSTAIFMNQLIGRMDAKTFRVLGYGLVTCLTTGLGALPFAWANAEKITEKSLAVANTVACGMMLSASVGMVVEAHEYCGSCDWQIFLGVLCGVLLISISEKLTGEEEESEIELLHGAIMERKHFRKAVLIFTVMFAHSAAEGIAVGVSFSQELQSQFGFYITCLLAVHNIPEGLTVALVLVPRGVGTLQAGLIAILTSVPQPLLAVAAFVFVEMFGWLLPLGLAFAAGAMIYVSLHELLLEAVVVLSRWQVFSILVSAFGAMYALQCWLQSATV